MPEETTEQQSSLKLAEALRILVENPAILDKLVNKKFSEEKKRRDHYSRLSNLSYYRERFALELKVVVDKMMEDGIPMEYSYEDFCTGKDAVTKNTLYLKIHQAKMFLIDNLDPDNKYKQFLAKSNFAITRERSGIRLSITTDLTKSISTPSPVSMDEKVEEWKVKVDKYLEEATVDTPALHLTGLSLSQEEILGLNESMVTVPDVLAVVTHKEIKIKKAKI